MRPRLIERLISSFAPHICLSCGVEADRLLCDSCVATLARIPSRCYHCKAVTEDYAVCRSCTARTSLRQVRAYTHHQDVAKELIHRMKYERAQAGVHEAAALMAELLPDLPTDSILTYIPTATSRVRSRGYDHARLLAHSLSRRIDRPVVTLLRRQGQAHQVGANRAARLRQLQEAFRPVRSHSLKDRHIVLIDDVLTTGATLETAARVLKRAGAKRVDAVVFAQV